MSAKGAEAHLSLFGLWLSLMNGYPKVSLQSSTAAVVVGGANQGGLIGGAMAGGSALAGFSSDGMLLGMWGKLSRLVAQL